VKAVHALGLAHEKNDAWGVVTISVGCALMDPAHGEVVVLFRQADARLYAAKSQGRNQAVLPD
jgi:PleD family two-component response regulator